MEKNKNKIKFLTNYQPKIQTTHISIDERNILQIKGINYNDDKLIRTSEFLDLIKINDFS